jgi:hypothetical protein
MTTILLNRDNNLCILADRCPKYFLLREAVVFSLSEHASYVLNESLSMKEGVNCDLLVNLDIPYSFTCQVAY